MLPTTNSAWGGYGAAAHKLKHRHRHSLSLSLSLHGFVFFALRILSSSSVSEMAAVTVSAGVVFKQGMSSLGPSEFVGKVAKQFAVAAPTVKSQNAAVISVRAAGYDEELVKTAVLRFFISFNNLSLHLCYYIVAVISVRAAGYDEELVETAVHDFIFLLICPFICVMKFFFCWLLRIAVIDGQWERSLRDRDRDRQAENSVVCLHWASVMIASAVSLSFDHDCLR